VPTAAPLYGVELRLGVDRREVNGKSEKATGDGADRLGERLDLVEAAIEGCGAGGGSVKTRDCVGNVERCENSIMEVLGCRGASSGDGPASSSLRFLARLRWF
jgi:hypothetical protein